MTPSTKNLLRKIPIAHDGWRFVLPILSTAAACLIFTWWGFAFLLLLAALAVGSFFRDFDRECPQDPKLILSPADGVVDFIDEVDVPSPGGEHLRFRRVSIILSIFNVHVQRAPMAGELLTVQYNRGKFLNAFNSKSSEENENNMIWIQGATGPFVVKQISGMIARRVVCPLKPGRKLAQGQRVGLIRFGSRTEAFFPLEAQIRTRPGRKVQAGLTLLAELE